MSLYPARNNWKNCVKRWVVRVPLTLTKYETSSSMLFVLISCTEQRVITGCKMGEGIQGWNRCTQGKGWSAYLPACVSVPVPLLSSLPTLRLSLPTIFPSYHIISSGSLDDCNNCIAWRKGWSFVVVQNDFCLVNFCLVLCLCGFWSKEFYCDNETLFCFPLHCVFTTGWQGGPPWGW